MKLNLQILKAIEKTNFNSIAFLKQDYFNLKKFLNVNTYLRHLDFINNDASVDLLRYIKKNGCYYEFLTKVEDDIPLFDTSQIKFLNYLSSFLPLIRDYEFRIVLELINGPMTYEELLDKFRFLDGFNVHKFDHALNNLMNLYYSKKERESMVKYLVFEDNEYRLSNLKLTESFVEHVEDLLRYGISKYEIDFYDVKDDIKLYYTYCRSSLLLALCHHTFASREGLIWKDNNLYIFIDLKKDLSKEEHLLFDDKFISDQILQWESSTKTTLYNKKGLKLINQKFVHIFVRKINKEDGVTLPYIYIGKGELTNPRVSSNVRNSLLFDIILEHKVPEYLKYDFEIKEDEGLNE